MPRAGHSAGQTGSCMSARVEIYHRPAALRTDYETPPALFRRLDAEFHFTIDVCATRKTSKCLTYLTPKQDGLTTPWHRLGGACWMNPPYGKQIGAWMQKAWHESQRGATVVCLVPARTDSEWWHVFAMSGEIRFIRGRIKFVGQAHNAPFPSAIVIFRPPVRA